MSYRWQAELAPGCHTSSQELVEAGIGTSFDDQQAAELWLGEYYLDLQEYGVTQVTLFNGDEVVLGPMSIEAER